MELNMKKLTKLFVCAALTFAFGNAFSQQIELPKIIDFSKLKLLSSCQLEDSQGSWSNHLGSVAYTSGFNAFNDAPELGVVMRALIQDYGIETVVETGTFMGSTTMFFANVPNIEVHTIDIVEKYYLQAKGVFKNISKVSCHLGSSDQVLAKILPNIQKKRVLFYLDAHWNQYWPLLNELKEIAKTHRNNCIIVIDDFKVPNRADIPYDSYGRHECSYSYIKSSLEPIFSDYSMHYLIPKDVTRKAKFVAIPKSWAVNN